MRITTGSVVQFNDKTKNYGMLGIVEEINNGSYTVLIPLPGKKTVWDRMTEEQLEYIGEAAFIRKR